jgi:hypothetical protein
MNPSPDITWKIATDPATLSGDEFWARYSHLNMPEKYEAIEGKLFWSDEHSDDPRSPGKSPPRIFALAATQSAAIFDACYLKC